MIKEYWESRPNSKDNPFRKKPRASSSKKEVPSAEDLTKRRRQAKAAIAAQITELADTDSDADDAPKPPKKKQKTETTTTNNGTRGTKSTSSKRRNSSSEGATVAKKLKSKLSAEVKDDEEEPGNMQKYELLKSWEHLVKLIQTVEKAEDDSLRVYFVM